MKYLDTGEYSQILEHTILVPFSNEYNLKSFDCGQDDYNTFLINDAKYYIDNGISSVHLLIHHGTQEIIGYIALLTDAFLLDQEEKESLKLKVSFSSVPAMKIGKLAVSINHQDYHYGSYLLWLSLGYASILVVNGIACRFLTVDADIEFNDKTPNFYAGNGFVINQHKQQKRKKSVSMRYDLYSD